MIVPFVDNVAGTQVTIVKLRDGETIRVRGDHEAVARKLQPAA
jgi:hypothetical protein